MYIHICMYIYIYIYIEREREYWLSTEAPSTPDGSSEVRALACVLVRGTHALECILAARMCVCVCPRIWRACGMVRKRRCLARQVCQLKVSCMLGEESRSRVLVEQAAAADKGLCRIRVRPAPGIHNIYVYIHIYI